MHRDSLRQRVIQNWVSKSFVLLAILMTSSVVSAQAPTQPVNIPRNDYIEFASRQDGNAVNGRKLFLTTPKTACFQCHRIDERHDTVGPNLAAIGDKFPRRELIQAILGTSANQPHPAAGDRNRPRPEPSTTRSARPNAPGSL